MSKKQRTSQEPVYLNPEMLKFSQTSRGTLRLETENGSVYDPVKLYRAFPYSAPDHYISLRDREEKEIGIIKDISPLPRQTRELLTEEMNLRYFMPEITNVLSLSEEFGYTYWNTETSAGAVRFTLQGGGQGITQLSPVRLILIDIEGNRFELPDYTKLSRKYQRVIEGAM